MSLLETEVIADFEADLLRLPCGPDVRGLASRTARHGGRTSAATSPDRTTGCRPHPTKRRLRREQASGRPAEAGRQPPAALRRGRSGDRRPGPAGDAVGLWAAAPDAAALVGRQPRCRRRRRSRPCPRPAVTIRVAVQDPGGRVLRVTTVHDFTFAYPSVGVLADGDLVLVGGRCAWSRAGVVPNVASGRAVASRRRRVARGRRPEHRGHLVGRDLGRLLRRGIYGNFGWGRPGPRPIGAPGLLRFSRSLDLVASPEDVRDPIDDAPT